jgi:hypothetical protein
MAKNGDPKSHAMALIRKNHLPALLEELNTVFAA